MKKHKYFTLKELCYSKTAEELSIDNTPKDEVILNNLDYTMDCLDEIREGWGKSITINSGYRCKQLNTIVKGADTS